MPPIGPDEPATAYPQGQDFTPITLDADGFIPLALLPVAQLQQVGSTGGSYRHSQPTAAATWSVLHQLGGSPTVVVQDASGVLGAEVVYVDGNTLLVKFSEPTAGTAQISL